MTLLYRPLQALHSVRETWKAQTQHKLIEFIYQQNTNHNHHSYPNTFMYQNICINIVRWTVQFRYLSIICFT